MKRRSREFNPKRRLRKVLADVASREALANNVNYDGNPEHKKNPGNFNLTPPAAPRPGKTLCDAAEIFSRETALRLLRDGVRRGLVSEREVSGWPQNIWAVSDNRMPLEAMLGNSETGTYHGYPMQKGDALSEEVIHRWFGSDA
jgi:hypothetical protein